ncbi:hypothetical protein T439DRAFT_322819 [Meredithblackwellia eburnea MCA 4105]
MSDPNYDTINIPAASQAFVDSIMGPPIAGWMANIFLWGYVMSNFVYYVQSPLHQKDRPAIKYTLYIVILLGLTQTALDFESLYHYATWQVRDSNTLFSQTATDCFATFFVGIEGAIVQVYLSMRASALFENKLYKTIYFFFVGIGVLSGLVGSICYLALSILLRMGKLDSALPMDFPVATGMWLWGCAFVDVLISASLCVLLSKRIVGFNQSTDNILRRLISLALQTASYTAVCALMGAILSYAFPADSLNANSSAAFWIPLTSLYAFAFITTLNSRARIRDEPTKSNIVTGMSGYAGSQLNSFNITVQATPTMFETPQQINGSGLNVTGFRTPAHLSPRVESAFGGRSRNSSIHPRQDEEEDDSSAKDFSMA